MCGSICGPTGSPIACSRAMRPSSRRPARPGATSWPNLKQSPQSECAIGHISVRDKGPWYKTLVGYQSVFPPAWESDEFNYKEMHAYRGDRIKELVNEIDVSNADKWLETLIRCARTESNDLATFPSFGQFLNQLSEEKPDVILGYLDQLDSRLASVRPQTLSSWATCGIGAFAQAGADGVR